MIKKQFISMAVCPQCQTMDTVVMYDDGGHRFRECVSCGFKDELLEQSAEPMPPAKDETLSVVSIIDPRQNKKP